MYMRMYIHIYVGLQDEQADAGFVLLQKRADVICE